MIGIINCDVDESLDTNGSQLIHNILKNSEIIDITKNQLLNYNYYGFIITGSRASFDDDLDWIHNLKNHIIEINKRNIPCLGICFGMQIIADCFGGSVIRNQVTEEGFTLVNLNESQLFKDLPEELFVYESHHDVVINIPENSLIIANNKTCIQGFKLNNFYCIQFHPEISAKESIIMANRDNSNIDLILNGINTEYVLPKQIFLNFLRICECD